MLRLANAQSVGHYFEVYVQGDSISELGNADECRRIAMGAVKQAMASPMIARQENVIVDQEGRQLEMLTDLGQLKTARFYRKITFTSGGLAR